MNIGWVVAAGFSVVVGGWTAPAPMPDVVSYFAPDQGAIGSASLQEAQAAAMANAGRPGDAAMSCDAIQAEVMTISQQPAMQSMVGKVTTGGAKLKTDLDAAEKKASATGQPDVAAGNKLSAQGNAFALQSAGDIQASMPQLMRIQKLTELGQTKNCAFLKGAGQ